MAASLRVAAIAVALFCICNGLGCYAKAYAGGREESLVSLLCNRQEWPGKESPFAYSLFYVLKHIIQDTPENGFDYYVESSYTTGSVCGHGVCEPELSKEQCRDCLFLAVSGPSNCAVTPIGAQVELTDCRLRYENYDFTE
ncbi:hypothetical protein CDL15_Pgr007198 [Punica granatum]|uniref:Gnk2-homologous domain-containing protein n=1 Tax=Punica granatum TaxID=22663 RepID=A0A218X897_PUNGR|nr:hypothetical protein CDL15_Pgr007198 [Punica granatum]